jgi:hypothetical protein
LRPLQKKWKLINLRGIRVQTQQQTFIIPPTRSPVIQNSFQSSPAKWIDLESATVCRRPFVLTVTFISLQFQLTVTTMDERPSVDAWVCIKILVFIDRNLRSL